MAQCLNLVCELPTVCMCCFGCDKVKAMGDIVQRIGSSNILYCMHSLSLSSGLFTFAAGNPTQMRQIAFYLQCAHTHRKKVAQNAMRSKCVLQNVSPTKLGIARLCTSNVNVRCNSSNPYKTSANRTQQQVNKYMITDLFGLLSHSSSMATLFFSSSHFDQDFILLKLPLMSLQGRSTSAFTSVDVTLNLVARILISRTWVRIQICGSFIFCQDMIRA